MYGIWSLEKDKEPRRVEPGQGERPTIASTPVEERRMQDGALPERASRPSAGILMSGGNAWLIGIVVVWHIGSPV